MLCALRVYFSRQYKNMDHWLKDNFKFIGFGYVLLFYFLFICAITFNKEQPRLQIKEEIMN